MQIRLACKKDLKGILSLLNENIEYQNQKGIKIWDHRYPAKMHFQNDIKKHFGYVIIEDNLIVAYGALYQYNEWDIIEANKDNTGYAMRIMVSNDKKRKGYGTKLMLYFDTLGFDYIQLLVHKINMSAYNFYLNLGYKVVKELITKWDDEVYLIEKVIHK